MDHVEIQEMKGLEVRKEYKDQLVLRVLTELRVVTGMKVLQVQPVL